MEKMGYKLVISLCVSLCTIVSGRNIRIIGGEPADIKEFPYSVSFKLISTGNHFCGGSIITNNHILTAAHCLTKHNQRDVRIFTGSSNYKISGQNSFAIASIRVHPQFSGELKKRSVLHHDIGVAKTDRPIVFSQYQHKIKLPSKEPEISSLGAISGWGSTIDSMNQHPDTLHKANMKVISNAYCTTMVPFNILDEQMCALVGRGVGACYGDSGIGLIIKKEIVGIASFVCPCATGKPDIYTRVYPYISFIMCVLNEAEFVIDNSQSRCSVL